MAALPVTPDLAIDEDEIELRFVRAAGPGGQNVNKVSTAVELRFDARRSPSLPNDVSIRLQRLAGTTLPNFSSTYNEWNIGYQYFGGITTWYNPVTPSGTPSRSPVKLSFAKPWWCFAADAVMKGGNGWGKPVQNDEGNPQAYVNLPQHHGARSLYPDGGNEAFVDGSASWEPIYKMRFLTSWQPSSGDRNFYFYQDSQDFTPLMLQRLNSLAPSP